ncbi:MAG: helix-turn-helix domain-containing protein, partial [Anaerolineales bacterium]|nr:helix-turn-helix domain-containing protein [Anaerolineales bacterium]
MSSEWLRLSEAAAILGVHPGTVRSWSDKGVLPVHRTRGGHRRYRRAEVELWVQSQRANAAS